MACPFAQLSPLVLLSLLALFFQFGASFFLPKPLMATLHRGRSFGGPDVQSTGRCIDVCLMRNSGRCASSKSKASSPPRGGGRAGSNNGPNSRVPRMLGVAGADVLAPPDYMSDLGADPFPWTECLGTGGPLLFADLLRWQVSALQLGLGLERQSCLSGMDSVCNMKKKARVRNLVYAGDRVRKLRISYLDTPGMQVYSSVSYSSAAHDLPLLGISAMSMGRVRVLAMDLQPLFTGPEYVAKYAQYYDRLRAIREKYPQLGMEMQRDYYKGSPFFSEHMLYVRWGPEEEASGIMESVIMPAFQECIRTYMDMINEAPALSHLPGSSAEKAILERQGEFDRFHAEREQVRPVMTANFGAAWAEEYISDFVFAYGSETPHQ